MPCVCTWANVTKLFFFGTNKLLALKLNATIIRTQGYLMMKEQDFSIFAVYSIYYEGSSIVAFV